MCIDVLFAVLLLLLSGLSAVLMLQQNGPWIVDETIEKVVWSLIVCRNLA